MLLTLLLTLQATAPAPAPTADDRGWTLVDGVAVQAGDHVVTLRTLDRVVRHEVERNRIQSQADIDELTQLILRQLVVRELESQAGEDFGLQREQIDRIIKAQLDENSSRTPSFVDDLQREGLDAFSWSQDQRKELNRYIWTKSKIGDESFGDKRPTRDKHIRPGELRAIYRVNGPDLDPDQVELQILVLAVKAAGGVDAARSVLEAARERAQAGEDFGALVEELASERVETRGLTGLLAVTSITAPGLKDFAVSAKVGDIGDIVPLPSAEAPQALVLPRLEQRVENETPPFGDRKVQTFLRRAFTEKRQERILGHERSELVQQAFTWVTPALRSAPAAPKAPDARGDAPAAP